MLPVVLPAQPGAPTDKPKHKKKKKKHNRSGEPPQQHGNGFSLLTELAARDFDSFETIGTLLLEGTPNTATLAAGVYPAQCDLYDGFAKDWKMRGFYAHGMFYVVEPLETKLLRLNSTDTALVTPRMDTAAKSLPRSPYCTSDDAWDLVLTEIESGNLTNRAMAGIFSAIDEEGAQFVVNAAGELLVNLPSNTLHECNQDNALRSVSHNVSGEKLTAAWVSELVKLPDAKLLPALSKEMRATFAFLPLARGLTLTGRPRIYAKIPIASRVPQKSISVWYAMLPPELGKIAEGMRKQAREDAPRGMRAGRVFEPRLATLVSATIDHFLFSSRSGVNQQIPLSRAAMRNFLSQANTVRRVKLAIDNTATFEETNAGQRLTLARHTEPKALTAEEAAAKAEADMFLDL